MSETREHLRSVHGIELTMERRVRSTDPDKVEAAIHAWDHDKQVGKAYPGWTHDGRDLFYPRSEQPNYVNA